MKSIFRLRVRGYELDTFGHVNNAVYLQYAEEAKWDFFNSTSTLGVIKQKNIFPVILENNVRYIHELKMHDDVRIETEWSTKGRILHFVHTMYREEGNVRSCVVKGKIVFADFDRVLHDIPDELLSTEIFQN